MIALLIESTGLNHGSTYILNERIAGPAKHGTHTGVLPSFGISSRSVRRPPRAITVLPYSDADRNLFYPTVLLVCASCLILVHCLNV